MLKNPLNSLGHIVLRIPVLFGTVEYLGESAVTCLLELLFNKAIKSVSDYEIRYPSHGCDIAVICSKLLELKMEGKPIQGISVKIGLNEIPTS